MINVQKDHALFMWNDDGELGREGRKRERDIAEWGERERNEMEGENGVGN